MAGSGSPGARAADLGHSQNLTGLADSASLIYRVGASDAEAHTDRGDFIIVRNGRTIVVGGTITEGKPLDPGKFAARPLTVPGESGQHLVTVVVKVVPGQ
jgi:hypothetical protein